MSITPTEPLSDRAGWLIATMVVVVLACFMTDPAWRQPSSTLLCVINHPDCAGNQWLLAWVADRLSHFQGLGHNDLYYWPFGDAPFLAGNGGEGFAYLPFHIIFGWPTGSAIYLTLLLAANGLAGAWFARAAHASWPGAVLAGAASTLSIYAIQELSSGRYSQVDMVWLFLFLGCWLRWIEAPSSRRALLAAATLAIASLMYWYYGFFGVIAGGVLLLSHRFAAPRPWRSFLLFVVAFLLMVAGPLAWFLKQWSILPGTEEVTFPHREAIADSLVPAVPFLLHGGRFVGQALPAIVVLGAAFSLIRLLVRRSKNPRLDLTLVLLYLVFLVLALGPRFLDRRPAPFTLLYGLAEPLRRFWWPSRHIVVANAALVVLAARAIPSPRKAWASAVLALLLAASVPSLLWLQRLDLQARVTIMQWPPPFYSSLKDLPGSVLLDLPIAPEASVSERPVLFQLAHKKTLLNGHAQWVERVRPPGWDDFVEGNSFLRELRRQDQAALEGVFEFEGRDLQLLMDQGFGTIVLNAENYPAVLLDCVHVQHFVLMALFGRPVSQMERGWAWSLKNWTRSTRVKVAAWTWPADLPTDGVTPRTPRTNESNFFHTIRTGYGPPHMEVPSQTP
jgi:hypothetical protein